MGKASKDANGKVMQVFTPYRMEAVTANVAWTPTAGDVAFAVTEDVSYKIDSGAEVTLLNGSIRGVVEGLTYTFSVSTTLEVM